MFPYSYLEALLPWEGSKGVGTLQFFELNACPREVTVPMMQLARMTGQFASREEVPRHLRSLITEIKANLRNYRPPGGNPLCNDDTADSNFDTELDFDVDMSLDMPPPQSVAEQAHQNLDHYHCCEAFRYALLLYILRVFDHPAPEALTATVAPFHARLGLLSRLTIDHVIAIREASPLRKQLLLALFLAGAETYSESHRQFIRDYCATWYGIYGYQMFPVAAEVLEDVWSTNDNMVTDGQCWYWWGEALDRRRRHGTGLSEDSEVRDLEFCFG